MNDELLKVSNLHVKVQEGDHETLMNNNGTYARMVSLQAS